MNTLVLIALMVGAFYFLLLRPQKKRQQEQRKTMDSIQPGTEVLLGSGIFGTVISVGQQRVVVETTPGVRLTVLKQAIARVLQPGDQYSEPAPAPVEADDDEPDTFDEPAGTEPTELTFGNEPKKD